MDYAREQLLAEQRTLSYERWTQYVHYFSPGLRLTRSKEDLCDCCVRIEVELMNPNLTVAEREALEAEKTTHIKKAVEQRRA